MRQRGGRSTVGRSGARACRVRSACACALARVAQLTLALVLVFFFELAFFALGDFFALVLLFLADGLFFAFVDEGDGADLDAEILIRGLWTRGLQQQANHRSNQDASHGGFHKREEIRSYLMSPALLSPVSTSLP